MEAKKYIAFADLTKKVASGSLADVAEKAKQYLLTRPDADVLIFDCVTSEQVEIDFRGSPETVRRRAEKVQGPDVEIQSDAGKKAGPGRPRLGVIAKEVTLLPQHWDWLNEQPGGASVTLRKLVEASIKKNSARDTIRRAQDAAYKFLVVTAGDRDQYEEVLRALYAQDLTKFSRLMMSWPKDLRDHALHLAEPSFRS